MPISDQTKLWPSNGVFTSWDLWKGNLGKTAANIKKTCKLVNFKNRPVHNVCKEYTIYTTIQHNK